MCTFSYFYLPIDTLIVDSLILLYTACLAAPLLLPEAQVMRADFAIIVIYPKSGGVEVEVRRFLESDSQGVGSLAIFWPATPELTPLGGVRDSRSLRLHCIKMTKF